MSLSLVETEPNLIWIFRGLSMILFIRHILESGSPRGEKGNEVSIK